MNLREEKGYALVITLIVIVFIFLFASLLLSSILNSRKQFNISEDRIHLIDIAEMGVIHYEAKVASDIKKVNEEYEKKEAKPILIEQYAEAICSKAYEEIGEQEVGPYRYEIHWKTIKDDCNRKIINGESVSIDFHSKGIAAREKVIQGSITLHPKSTGLPIIKIENKNSEIANDMKPLESDDWLKDLLARKNYLIVKNPVFTKGKDELVYPLNTEFQKEVDLRGNSSLTINGSGYFSGVFSVRGNNLRINGHAYFANKVDINGSHQGDTEIIGNAVFKQKVELGNNGFIKINGDAYFYDDIDIKNKGRICVNGKTYRKGIEQTKQNSFPKCMEWGGQIPETPKPEPGKDGPIYIFNPWGATYEIKVNYYK